MQIVFLLLFICFSVIHLYFSWKDEEKGRAYTKPFLLLFLMLYYASSAHPVMILLLIALLTSWLGDVLLIPKGDIWFFSGGIFFMASHVCFILIYIHRIRWEDVLWLAIIGLGIVYFGIAAIVISKLWATMPKQMIFPMFFYLITNSTMNLFAAMQLMSEKNLGALLAYCGALLFFGSDCTLYLVRYDKNPDLIYKRHFTVMLTYLSGEFLIAQGMLCLPFVAK